MSAALAVGVTLGAVTASQSLGAITTPGAVSLRALGGSEGAANASAQTVNAALKTTGVGGAVAVNVGNETVQANVESTVASGGLALFAGPNRESAPNFTATAASGQSVAPVTVAGALTINVATTDAQAEIAPEADVDVNGGNVLVIAQGGSQSSATSTAQPSPGAKIGLGASVAVNVAFDTTLAAIDGAPVSKANNVTLSATSNANALAGALAGSAALDASAAAISVNFADRNTTAEVTAGPELNIAGTLTITASGTGLATSLASAADIGLASGLGTAIGADVPLDNVTAQLARDVTAGATIQIMATSTTGAGGGAVAGALGNSGPTSADTVIASIISYLNNGPAASNAPSFPDLAGDVASAANQIGLTLPSFEAAAAISADASIANTHASIADGVSVSATGRVVVTATGLNDAVSSASSAASQSAGAVGLALGADYAQRTIQATIGQNAAVTAGAILVLAHVGAPQQGAPTLLSEALAVSSASGAGAGAAASLALDLVADKTIASVGNGATLVSKNGIGVAAVGSMTGVAESGATVNASAAGVGVALAANLIDDQSQAFFGTGVHADSPGIMLIVASETQVLDAEAQSGLGGGDADIPASISVNVLLANTHAYTGAGDELNQAGLQPGQVQSIFIDATDATFITGNAGVLGGRGFGERQGALAGAAADFGFVDKQTQADLGGTASAADNIVVASQSTQLVASHAQSDGFAYLADIAGSAAVQMETLTTNALIDANANVNAGNNVVILSHDTNSVGAIADAHSAADGATAGAGITAISTAENTAADVAGAAVVNAGGTGAPIDVDSGQFAISYSPASTAPGQVGRSFLPGALTTAFNIIFTNPLYVLAQALTNSTVGFLDISPISSIPDNPDVSQQRSATPVQRLISGLAITALSQDDLETSGSGYGAAFGASPELSGAGVVAGGATSAFIGAGAQINLDRDGASPTQSVLVTAGTDTYAINLAGTTSLAGIGAVGAAVTLDIIQPTTQAYVGAGAQVQTSTDVDVLAKANEEVVGVATGITAGAVASLAGSFPVVSIATSTFAHIDQNAVVSAPNNILVYANDTTSTEPVAGVLSAGGAVGFGTSAAVTLIGKDTQAWIATNAQVDAGGFGASVEGRGSGGIIAINPDTSSSPFTTIHGVSVLASSSEQVTDLAVAGAPSLLLGIAGSVSVELIGNTTAAHIDKNAKINASGAPASAVQTVAVGAYDDTETIAADAALDAGLLVQVGGAADLQVIRNNTLAFVAQGAVVNAALDINIVGRSQEFAQSFAGGAGVSGLVGINGSVSAVSIGDVIGGQLLDALSAIGGPGTVQGTIDNTITSLITQGGDSFLKVLNQYAQGVGGDQPAATAMSIATPNAPVTTAVVSTVLPAGTDAAVVGATITAGRDVNVKARDNLEDAQDTSFTFNFSLFSSPLSIAIDAGIVGGRANANAGVGGGATITAGRNINVASDADANQIVQSTYAFNTSADNSLALVDDATLKASSGNVNVTASGTTKTVYSALLPGFSGLSLRLSYNELRNSIVAEVDDNSIVTASGIVDVIATDTVDVDVISNGCTLIGEGFLDFALAGSLAWNNVADTVSAGISHSNINAGDVIVIADEAPTLTAISLGVVESSDVAIGGGAAINQIQNTVHAYVSDGAVVVASGPVGIVALDQLDLKALAGAAAAVATVSVGAAFTYNIIGDSITAEISGSNVTSTGSAVHVDALTTGEDESAAVGITEADAVTGDGSVPINKSSMTVTAQIVNSTVAGYSGVTVRATDSSEIKALAGSIVVSLGAFAAGAAVADNTISDQTTALISDSTVASSHGSVNVTATANPEIDVLAAGAGGSNSFSLAGSVSINTISDTVDAKVNSHSALSGKVINITATDAPVIKSITGALSIGVGVAAVSGSVSDNVVTDMTLAEDRDSKLTAGTVSVKALSNPQVFALAAAGAASGAVSVEGAVTLNKIGSSTIADITGAGAVVTAGSVSVKAQDEAGSDKNPGIQSIAAGISLGSTVGVGGSVALNTISDTVGAGIFGKAQVNATTIAVTSVDDPDIEVLAGTVGAGGTVAVNGSVAINTVSDTIAALVNNATINASGAAVMATSSPTIESLALVGGISGTVTAVASVTTNTIHSQTDAAIIGGSTVSLGGGGLTVSADDQSTIKSLSGAVGGSGTVAAAAAFAFNTIDSTSTEPAAVLASINGSTVNAGSVSVTGTNGASLLGIAISGTGAGTVAFGGSGVGNIDETTTTANVTNAKVTLPGTLSITATDASDVGGYAGNADGAGVASGGAAVVVNRIGNVTQAQDLGGISQVGTENVSASATGTDQALAVSGSGAATAAGVFDDTENIVYDTVTATIGAGATVIANGVTLSAADSMTIWSLAGSAAGAGAFAGSGAHAQNDIGATSSSRPSDILASIEGGASVNAGTVTLTGTFSGNIKSIGIGVSGAGGVTGDASIVDSVIDQPVGTRITGGTTHVTATGSVSLATTDSSTILAVAGAAEGSGILAAGASITTSTINDSATASVAGATVTATGGASDVALSAQSTEQIEVFALAIGGSGVVSIQGAVDSNTMGSTTQTTVTGGADVTAGRNVTLNADNNSQIKSLAVSVAGAGGAGIAGAVADNQIGNQTEANITGSTVTATHGGVSVGASADGEIQSLSAALGGGVLGVSGGVSINQIGQTIEAYVDQNSVVTADSKIEIRAKDTATIKSLAGQAAGGFVGIGGAVAYNDITDTVQASAQTGSTLTADGDITLDAEATGTINTIAVGGSFGLVGVAGSVAVAHLGDNVFAFTDNASVTTPDNVVVTAVTTDNPEIWAGSLGVGFVGVAGTVAVETTSTFTDAYTKGGTITALGLGSAATVPTMNGQSGAVSNTTNVGLIITALNSETPSIYSGTAAGGAVGVAGNVSVISVGNFTDASIGGSTINSPSVPGAAVIVRAFQSTNVNVLNGAAGVGIAGIAGAVSVIEIENSTSASITEAILTGSQGRHETPSSVTAKYIEVTARGYENVTDGVVGVAAGLAGVAGSVSYVDVQNFTATSINTSVVDAIGGVGAIAVNSSDTTSISPTTGAVAGGFVGAAAGVSVNDIQNQTESNLVGAQLNATGAITIDATNTATIDSETVAGAGGVVGIGAAVAVNTIESTTETNFETPQAPGASPTLINQDARFQKGGKFGVGSGQTVSASATDTATIDSDEGAAGVGIGAAGAAIDVDSIRDHVVTEAQVGTRISAVGNVSLTATSSRNASTNPLAIGVGAVAIDGSITVINLGAELSSAAAAQFPSGVRSNVDSSLMPTTQGVNPNDGQAANAAEGGIDSVAPQGVDGVLDPNAKDDAVTAVILDSSKSNNVTISAGGSLNIAANNTYNVQVDAGSATGGLAGFGLAGAFVSITDNTVAQIGARSQLAAGNNLTVGVSDTANGQSLVQVFAGAGALLGVAGSIGDVTLNLTVAATVGSHAVLNAGGNVSVTANQNSNISAQGLNFTFGALSVGVVDTAVTVQGTVTATLADHVFIGAPQSGIGGLKVTATADNIAQVATQATTGGVLVGGQVNAAIANVDPRITAEIGAGDAIVASGNIVVNAASSGGASASAQGTDVSGLGSLGESDAEATVAPIAIAQVDTAAVLNTFGAVTIEASQLIDGAQDQVSADATAGGGAAGVAGNGALAIATSSGQAFATVLSQVQISAGGGVSALATAGNAGNARATGLNIGGIAADGGTHAEVDDNGGARATFSSNVTISQAGGLNIIAASADYGTAFTEASGGGLVSLNGNAPDGAGSFVNLAPVVIATLGVADQIATSGTATISAIDLAAGATDGEGTGIGGIDVGESIAQTTINPTVRSSIGAATKISTSGNVSVTARQGGPAGVINGHNLGIYNATGQSSANADGSSGSLLGGGESTQATISVSGGLSAIVGSGAQVSAGQDVSIITSFSFVSNATGGSTSVGGLVSVGGTDAQTTINLTNLAEVLGSATLNAGRNVTVSAGAAFNNDGSTNSDGGGGIAAGSSASTTVQILQSTQANIGNGASITAGNNLTVAATSSYASNVSSSSSAGGLGGSDSHAYAIYQVGDPSTSHQDPTTVFVGQGAVLTAPNTVNLTAIVQRWSANGMGSSSAGALGASAVTNVELDDLSLAQVTVEGQVTGDAAINVLAEQQHIGVGYNLSASATGLFFVHSDSTLTYDHVVTSFILVPKSGVLETHALTLNAQVEELDPPVDDGQIDYNLTFDFKRTISFDGTALILSSDPTLTIASNGTATADEGVNYSISNGEIVVGTINGATTGTITFETSPAGYHAAPGSPLTEMPSLIEGSKGSVVFIDTLSNVTINNASAMPLVINGINPLDTHDDAGVKLVGDQTPIDFAVGVEFEPTQIEINSASGVTLDGMIDNPIGDTSITSLNGSVLASAGGQIIGETIEIKAIGDIGSSANPLAIAIVEGGGAAGLTLTAGQNVNIDLTGDLRSNASLAIAVSNVSIDAGDNITVELEPGLDQNSTSGSPDGVTVGAAASTGGPTTNTHVYNHYHVDTGSPSPLPIGLFAAGGVAAPVNYQFTTLSAGGNIVISDPGPSISITATTTLTGTGALSVNVSGDISITEATGSLKVGSITSTGGSVSLSALAGDIVANGPSARVSGHGITLTASDGGIGTASRPIAIMLAGGSALSANADQAIDITEATGNIDLDEVDSTSGDITFATTNGSILDATGRSETNVMGRRITLTANGGSVGLASDHLTASSSLGESGISATATDGVYLDDPPAPAPISASKHTLLFDDSTGAFVSSSSAKKPQMMLDEAGAEWVVDGQPSPLSGDDLADWLSAA